MSITLRRPADPGRRDRRLVLVVVTFLVAALAPLAATPSGVDAASPRDAPAGGLQPTVQYEDAMAHADDRIAFAPGDRVTVPFKPRTGDTWRVGGVAPRALPAGRISGRSMREDLTVAPRPAVSPDPIATPEPVIDAPAVDPAEAIPADPALWSSSSGDATVRPAAAVSSGGLRREIFGFLPYWEVSDSSTRLDWEKLSTVAYFGVGATATGGLLKTNKDGSTTVGWSGWTSSKMTSIINDAHAHHTRVVLTVQSFAWTSSQLATQKALLGSATARLNLARQVATAIRDRGADGVNLDFEPIASGYSDEFTALVRAIRSELDRVAKGYQLTFDTTGYIGNYPIEDATATGGADAVFIMGYDYRSSASSPVGSIAPVGGPLYDVGDTVRAFVSRVSPSKLILGVPYYGRAWSTKTDTLNATNQSGTKFGTSVTVLYGTAVDLAAQNGRRYDPVEGVAWTAYKRQSCTSTYGCVTSWRELYYDDATSLKAKYDLVNTYGLRGAGIWALGYDGTRTELYQAIKDKFITDSIPPVISSAALTSTVLSPNGDGRLDTVRASLVATGLDKWGWLIEPMSGSTADAAIMSGKTTTMPIAYTWNGTRADGSPAPNGVYRITLWTADASNNLAQRQFTVTLDTSAPVIGSRASPSSISPNGDGRWDLTTLRWSASERVVVSGRIIDRTGTTVATRTLVTGLAGATSWTGRDTAGRIVADGHYRFRVVGSDAAGNRTIRDLPVDVDRTIGSVGWSDRSFDPRAGQRSQMSFTLRRVATVSVGIYQGTTLVRSIWTAKPATAGTYRWNWDGKSKTGATVKPGTYRVLVTATSWIGVSRLDRSVTVEIH